jgi:hypothetical protein
LHLLSLVIEDDGISRPLDQSKVDAIKKMSMVFDRETSAFLRVQARDPRMPPPDNDLKAFATILTQGEISIRFPSAGFTLGQRLTSNRSIQPLYRQRPTSEVFNAVTQATMIVQGKAKYEGRDVIVLDTEVVGRSSTTGEQMYGATGYSLLDIMTGETIRIDMNGLLAVKSGNDRQTISKIIELSVKIPGN